MRHLLALLFVCCAATSFAQVRVSSFSSAGYEDQTITGVSGTLLYYLKVNPDDDMDNATLTLQFQPSQVLNASNSFVVIYLKDKPAITYRISGTDSNLHITLPLKKEYVQPDGRFLQLKLQARLASGDEICRDLDNPGIWLKVKSSSFFTVAHSATLNYQRSLKEWMEQYNTIRLPASASVHDIAAAAGSYTLLRHAAEMPVQVSYYGGSDSSVGSSVIAGLKSKLPAAIAAQLPEIPAGYGYIQMVNTPTANYFVITGIDETGYQKAIRVLAEATLLSGTFSDRLLIRDAPARNDVPTGSSNFTLADLGGKSTLQEGVGNLQSLYTFTSDQLSTIPTSINLHLEAYHTALRETDRGYINVYLNESLAYSGPLSNSGNLAANIKISSYLVNKFNTLKIEFRFHPGTNLCKDGFVHYFAGINVNTSQLSFSGNQKTEGYSFFQFPLLFKKGETAVVMSSSLLNKAAGAIAELYYQMNKYATAGSRLLLPPIYTSDDTSNAALSNANIIAVLTRDDPYMQQFKNVPVKYDKDFTMYPDETKQTKFGVQDLSGSAMAQVFNEGSKAVLLITGFGEDSTGKSYTDVIHAMNQQITSLESNICIANGTGNSFFRSSDSGKFIIYGDEHNRFQDFWKKYQYWILGAVLILIFLAFLFVSGKVKQSQAIITDNDND